MLCSVDQSRPTLCNTMDSNLMGSFVHGILQARILEWAAISFSKSLNKSKEFLKTELDRKANIVEANLNTVSDDKKKSTSKW